MHDIHFITSRTEACVDTLRHRDSTIRLLWLCEALESCLLWGQPLSGPA